MFTTHKQAKQGMVGVALVLSLAMGGAGVVGALTPAIAQAKTPVAATAAATKRAIGSAKATSIALAHAKLTKAQVTRLSIKTSREKGLQVYEVEFRRGSLSYEYDIDLYTGKIVDREVEKVKK